MPLINIPKRLTKEVDNGIVKKASTKVKTTTTVKSGGGLIGRIAQINSLVQQNLGKYEEESILIQDMESLHNYISKCIKNGVISIDTETTGLNPISDKLAGVCIYTPNEKTAYIPVNHESYITFQRVEGQLNESQIKEEFERLNEAKTKVIMFNAPFDIRVLRNQCGVYLKCYWDCYLGARLLNENEETNALKLLHRKYILNGKEDAFKFDELFRGIVFTQIPIKTAYLYAAHDAKITYELYEFQKQYLYYEPNEPFEARNGMNGVSYDFFNIEMPIVEVVADMEDRGVEFDNNLAHEFSIKYHKQLDEKLNEFYKELDRYSDKIEDYKLSHPNHKLGDPINISSPTQLSVLFYDILDIGVVDKLHPKGTGTEILSKLDLPIAKKILEYRAVDKLLTTYIDKLPSEVNQKTGRIHCKFNSYGADTGRFSSNDPKQNWALA